MIDHKTDNNEPIPPFGHKGFQKELKKYLKYPDLAIKFNSEGTVYLSAMVGEDGTLSDIKIEKDDVGHGCGEAAIKAIQKMPQWKSAEAGEKNNTNITITIPVEFHLRDMSRFRSKWRFNLWRRIGTWVVVIVVVLYIMVRAHFFSLYH